MRRLFSELLVSDVPIVFHNALIDLVFLYQCFYCDLPPTLASFLADLCEAFPGGVYDTKFISEFKARWPASYLEYIFRKRFEEFFKQKLLFVFLTVLKHDKVPRTLIITAVKYCVLIVFFNC